MNPTELRAWRDARNLSRREAAAFLRINDRTLEDLEYGRSPKSALWGLIGLVIELIGDYGVVDKAGEPTKIKVVTNG